MPPSFWVHQAKNSVVMARRRTPVDKTRASSAQAGVIDDGGEAHNTLTLSGQDRPCWRSVLAGGLGRHGHASHAEPVERGDSTRLHRQIPAPRWYAPSPGASNDRGSVFSGDSPDQGS